MPKSPRSCSPSRVSSSSARKYRRKQERPTFRATLSSRSPRDERLLNHFSELIASTLNLPVEQLTRTSPTAQRKTLNLSGLASHQLDKVDELMFTLLSKQPKKASRSMKLLSDFLKNSANTMEHTTESSTTQCPDANGKWRSTGTTAPPAQENHSAPTNSPATMCTANLPENGGTDIKVNTLLSSTNSEQIGCPSTIYYSFAMSIPLTWKSKEEPDASVPIASSSPAPNAGTNYSEDKPTKCSTNWGEESLKQDTSLIDFWPYEDLTK